MIGIVIKLCRVGTGPIRFGIEVPGSGVANCTLVHFGELWPTFLEVVVPSSRHIGLIFQSCTASATPTFRT
jgi:hypothetical protein